LSDKYWLVADSSIDLTNSG